VATAVEPQTSIYEKEIANDVLEEALERREALKEPRRQANADYRVANDAVKALLEGEELGVDATVRVGRFVITKKLREGGRRVEFETASSERYAISLLDDAA